MGFILVSGGQYGSEGKGKVTSALTQRYNAAAAVRVGGPNSGHTVIVGNRECKLRMLPTAALTTECLIIFPAGSYINTDILFHETEKYNVKLDRIKIDNNAVLLTNNDASVEKELHIGETISSTLSGTGAGVIRRISRTEASTVAKNHLGDIHVEVCDTKKLMRTLLDNDQCIIVEGTQGYELSVLHTRDYPFATARDTSAAGILSEVGGSLRDVDKVVTVFRTFPIRVAGNSGPLPAECTFEEIARICDSKVPLQEYTTVTNRPRRISKLDVKDVMRVCQYERPDLIVFNFLDYIDASGKGSHILTTTMLNYLTVLEFMLKRKIDIVGTGPNTLIYR